MDGRDNRIWGEKSQGRGAQEGSGRWLTWVKCTVGWLYHADPSSSQLLEKMHLSTPSLKLCWPVNLSPQSTLYGRSLSRGRFPESGWDPSSVPDRLQPFSSSLVLPGLGFCLGLGLPFLGLSSLLGSLLPGPPIPSGMFNSLSCNTTQGSH